MVEKLNHTEIENNRLREEVAQINETLKQRTESLSRAFDLMARKLNKLKKRCRYLSSVTKDVRP